MKPYNTMIDLVSKPFPMVFLRTDKTVLGNGKSAFMAAVYWDLHDRGRNVLWAEATSSPQIRDLLSKVLDSLVREGEFNLLYDKLDPITPRKIKGLLAQRRQIPAPSTVHAILQLLEAEEHEITYVYSNIKRRIPVQSHVELFGSLLELLYSVGAPRFVVFIDQFEEYVRCHRTMSERRKLSDEFNDLLRCTGESTTLVVTLHPEAERILTTSGSEFETFIRIEQSSVDLPEYSEENLVQMVKFYLKNFRPKGYHGDALHPFDETVVKYSTHRTNMTARDLMIALRAALIYGSSEGFQRIDERFLMRHHREMFGGLENKWRDFKSGKFRHLTE